MNLLQTKVIISKFIFVISLLSIFSYTSSLQCKGEDNQNVDWYVLYKIPKIPDSTNSLIKKGVAYLYMDSTTFTNGWTLSNKDISTNNSIPAFTLAPFYDDNISKNMLWLIYNDQPPNQPSKFNNGHAKGTVVVNDNAGFWLIHSVPGFPPEPNTGENVPHSKIENTEKPLNIDKKQLPNGGYAYPSSGQVNGQSFLCISTNKDNFNVIGRQLMYNQIIVYRRNIPTNLLNKYSDLVNAANQMHIKKVPYNSKKNFYSTGGMEFVSFAKSSKWQKDLYDDFVAPQLNTDLYTETWLNGRGKLPSECNQTRVFNIQSISLPSANVQFKSSHDHSKWAVSVEGSAKFSWVCVGDINRANTQFDRGGGTVCLNLPELWKNYKNSIKDVEPCPKITSKGFLDRVKSWFGWKFNNQ